MKRMRAGFVLPLCALVLVVSAIPAPAAHEEGFGNNLSVPLLFAEGYGVTGYPVDIDPGLRPDDTGLVSPTVVEGVTYYEQATENTWQSDWADKSGTPKDLRVGVKFGDNLMSHTFRVNQMIRVETSLLKVVNVAMTSFPMTSLGGSHRDEIWGTTGITVETTDAYAYTVTPKLLIWKIDADGHKVSRVYSGVVARSFGQDGPGWYKAEVTGAGAVVYGYRFVPPKAGWYRIVFKLLPEVTYTLTPEGGEAETYTVARHIRMMEVLLGEEGEEPIYVPELIDRYTAVLEIEVKKATTA